MGKFDEQAECKAEVERVADWINFKDQTGKTHTTKQGIVIKIVKDYPTLGPEVDGIHVSRIQLTEYKGIYTEVYFWYDSQYNLVKITDKDVTQQYQTKV